MIHKILLILLLFPILCSAQSDQEYFELALKKYQDQMNEINTFAANFNLDSLLHEKIEGRDTIYYCDYSRSKKLEDLTSLDLSNKKVINVNKNWLDSNRIFIFGVESLNMKRDSLDLFLLYYQKGDLGLNWVEFSKKPAIEKVNYYSAKILNKNKLPLEIHIDYIDSRLNITNYQYGLPAEIYYRESSSNFNSFNFTTEIRRFKLLKSETFIRLEKNVTVRIIYRGRSIKNYTVKREEGGKFLGPIYKPTRSLKRLH